MKIKKFIHILKLPSTIGGLLLIILGTHILITGELRSLVMLGNEKFIIGGVILLIGIVVIVVPLIKRN